MICNLCATAADRQAPKTAHCNDTDRTQCDCQHRTGRYATGGNPAFRTSPEPTPARPDGQ